jgi:hypothetical protein
MRRTALGDSFRLSLTPESRRTQKRSLNAPDNSHYRQGFSAAIGVDSPRSGSLSKSDGAAEKCAKSKAAHLFSISLEE